MRDMGVARWRVAVWMVAASGLAGLPARAQEAASGLQNAVIEVVEKVKPAVVSITAERVAPATEAPTPGPQPPTPGPQQPPAPQPPRPFGTSRGSGMLFRETEQHYFILTNAHVVREAKDGHVKVQIIAEREERDGTVVAYDTRTDTGVVRIDRRPTDKLVLVKTGQVADLKPGSFVLAIGSPFGFEWSVSFGVVSGLDRELLEPGQRPAGAQREVYRGLIQTDASINPGNSGGPLIDLKGEVIGINFAIYSPGAAGNVGVGFAIPIDRATHAAEQIIQYGRVRRGFIGVSVIDLETQAKNLGTSLEELRKLLGVDQGAFVDSVIPDTPGARAGIEPGDVIVSFNGETVASQGDLVDRVGKTPPDTEVKVGVVRDGQPLELNITLMELPSADTRPAGGAPPAMAQDPLGLKVAPLTPEKAKELGYGAPGLVVLEVAPNSAGAQAGLVPNCILLRGRMGTETVKFERVEAYQQFMAKAAEGNATVLLWYVAPPERPGAKPTLRSRMLKVPKAAEGQG